jgi:outer membrane receptor protein involved in Fe transport
VTIIQNGGNARIRGIENEIEFQATEALNIATNFTFLDPRLTSDYCGETDPVTGVVLSSNPCPGLGGNPSFSPKAPAGTNLPVTPKFKGNVIVRYGFPEVADWKPTAQAAWVYQTQTAPQLRVADANAIGMQPAYGVADLSAGIEKNGMNIQFVVTNVTDKLAQLTRFEQCTISVCTQPYAIPIQPRTYTIKFGQKF